MFVLQAIIKNRWFTFMSSTQQLKITKSVDELADTCTIELPKPFKVAKGGEKPLYWKG